jgi:tetratricopeptide (TPR) repeat protein
LCELAPSLRRTGRLDEARAALAEALLAAKAANDARTEYRARIDNAYADLFTDPQGTGDEVLELVRRATPVFDEASDDRALGRAWSAAGLVHSFRGQNLAWAEAEGRAGEHLRRAGWSPSAAPGNVLAAAFQGPQPVQEAMSLCRSVVTETPKQLRAQAIALVFLGGLEAMLGRFAEARRDVERGRALCEELGDRVHPARACIAIRGLIETLAGDVRAAERAWREGCAILTELRDVSFLASHAAELADVLYEQDRYEEAEEQSHVAEEHAAPDDVYTQILWRLPRSKVLARKGDSGRAESLALEAVELATTTDALVIIGRAHLALAEVLGLGGRYRDALAAAHAGLDAFKRKGDVASARRARAVISRLEAEGALAEMATV